MEQQEDDVLLFYALSATLAVLLVSLFIVMVIMCICCCHVYKKGGNTDSKSSQTRSHVVLRAINHERIGLNSYSISSGLSERSTSSEKMADLSKSTSYNTETTDTQTSTPESTVQQYICTSSHHLIIRLRLQYNNYLSSSLTASY